MTTGFYKTEKVNRHRTYGGIIRYEDYEYPRYMSDIASDILHDIRFDQQCAKNIEQKKKYKERGKK